MNIVAELQKAVAGAAGADASAVHLEHPQDLSFGDYATNIALVLAKERDMNPKELAEEIVAKLDLPFVETIAVAGPGFINFTLSRAFFSEVLEEVVEQGKSWGKNDAKKGKRVIIEYVNANAFKQLHIGHLMGAAIGEALSRVLEFSGAELKRESYGGDVGPHVAKAIYGLKQLNEEFSPEVIGKAYALGAKSYEEDAAAKEEIDALNKEIYKGEDAELMKLHAEGKKASMEAIEETLSILGTKLDRFIFESESAPHGLALVEEGLEEGVFEESDGAVVYKGEEEGLHTRVFRTRQGTPTYEAKEMGLETVKDMWWEHDESVVLTGREQKEYFKVVKSALSKLRPTQAEKIIHIVNGLLKLSEGKMSSRSGNVITARSLIEEVATQVREQSPNEEVALQVGVGAIKYAILKQQPGSDIVYDVHKSLSLEGDSGPYLQYALVRSKKILTDAMQSGDMKVPESPYKLERLLYRFPEVILHAQREYAPHHITQFLTELAGEFNSFYAHERIIGGEYEQYKLLLTKAFAQTLENGLWLLGMPAPERM